MALWKFHGPKPRKNQFMCMGKKIQNTKPLNFNDVAKKKNKIK